MGLLSSIILAVFCNPVVSSDIRIATTEHPDDIADPDDSTDSEEPEDTSDDASLDELEQDNNEICRPRYDLGNTSTSEESFGPESVASSGESGIPCVDNDTDDETLEDNPEQE